jgi:transcriptional regulatory protein RtcR
MENLGQDKTKVEVAREIDLFDRLQLEAVVAVMAKHKNLADAGRTLFQISRTRSSSHNDSDRLKKYLEKFGLDWRKYVGKS